MTEPYDIVVYGATSFVGQILCRYLVGRHGTDGPLRWAIAGRNPTKLDEVASGTGADVERIVADSSDRASLARLAGSTRVVVSTVGPYAQYGSELVAAVAAAGTDYCDLTGETQWMRRMIDAHSATAQASGARIVHACGFDSIPSDLGVWFTQQRAIEQFGVPCSHIAMQVASLRGGASGGTIASMLNLVEEMVHDPALRALMRDPYALAPPDQRTGPTQTELMRPTHDAVSGKWLAPFVMAGVNTRVVQRSHALLGRPWGPNFRYDEAMSTSPGVLGAAKAAGVVAGVGVVGALAALGPTRRLLRDHVLPKPGTGPSPKQQEAGYFDIRFYGTTSDGRSIETKVTGDRDPGYGSTAGMLGESAAALLDTGADVAGGFWTTATLFGDRLIERLEQHAGVRFDVVR